MTAFCHGMGTASSVMGVSDALKPHGVFIQAHEPASSAAISGGERGSFLIQGWTGLVMPHWDPEKVDHLEPIGDEEAIEMTLRLSREEGIFAGISTGANVVGAHRLAERLGPDAVIVTLAVDTGFKYMSVSPYARHFTRRGQSSSAIRRRRSRRAVGLDRPVVDLAPDLVGDRLARSSPASPSRSPCGGRRRSARAGGARGSSARSGGRSGK